MPFNIEDPRNVEFHNAPVGRRGYAKPEVDALLDRIARTFDNEDDLTAAEVHHASFSRPLLGKRGYDEREVDAFLDTVEAELLSRTTAARDAHQVPIARESSPDTTATTETEAWRRQQQQQ